MNHLSKGSFVHLTCDILQHGHCSRSGSMGIITAIENGKAEVITEEFQYINCTNLEITPVKLMSYEEAQKILESYCGHYCTSYDSFQFNIKFYHYNIPQLVSQLCTEKAAWDRYNEILNQSLEDFMGQSCDYGLSYIIPWLRSKARSDWWQAGRSGGWLVVKCGTDCESVADDISFWLQQMSDLRELFDAADQYEDTSDIVKEFKSLAKSVITSRYELRVLATQLDFITKVIQAEKKTLSQYLSSMEPWKELLINTILENHYYELEELEEKEKLNMPDTKPLKESFEADLKNTKQLTESYCLNAYRLLQTNNNNFTLLVLWEDRIASAIHEQEALLKSSKRLLTQLDEDIDALKLLRQEISIRLSRQEKSVVA